MTCAVATEEALGIEYDEQTACDVCRDVRKMSSSYMSGADNGSVWECQSGLQIFLQLYVSSFLYFPSLRVRNTMTSSSVTCAMFVYIR